MKSPDAAPTSPETLARVIIRCRELATHLEASVPLIPTRDEAPFLFGQLDDVLHRLHATLRKLEEGAAPPEKSSGFLRLLSGGKKPRQPARRPEPRYDLEGNAWTIPVTELVGFLSHTGKSGLLWVTTSDETFVLEFSNGSLVHATSNAPPASFRLGEILLREKMLRPEELARLIEHARAADDLLGSYLVRSGRLGHGELQRALTIQVQQLFHRLMDAGNAIHRFQEGAQLLRSQSLEVNITHLLLESARQKDEQRQQPRPADAPRVESAAPQPPTATNELNVLDEPLAPPSGDLAPPSENQAPQSWSTVETGSPETSQEKPNEAGAEARAENEEDESSSTPETSELEPPAALPSSEPRSSKEAAHERDPLEKPASSS